MEIKQLIGAIILGLLFAVPTYYVFLNNGTIKIERPYHNEYKQCKTELKLMEKDMKCPEVKCVTGITGIFWSIIGFIAMFCGMLFLWYTNNRYDRKDEELKRREEDVTKAEAELYKKSIKK